VARPAAASHTVNCGRSEAKRAIQPAICRCPAGIDYSLTIHEYI